MTAQGGAAPAEVSSAATLGELVASQPGRAALFERLRFDYCCGGGKTLGDACRERGLDPGTIRRLILAEDAAPDLTAGVERREWQQASLTELCQHIVEVHHDGLRRRPPQVGKLIDSVVRVHGPVHPDLRELPAAFATLCDELEPHLELEEEGLFPACRALEARVASASLDEAQLDAFEHDHHKVGAALARLRELTDGYDAARALCQTHRRLSEALRTLQLDLHQHVHEENNILLRLRSTLHSRQKHGAPAHAHPPGRQVTEALSASQNLPRCCQGWLAENTHFLHNCR
jgi:regulator of cell morphogenesis and NO signaling